MVETILDTLLKNALMYTDHAPAIRMQARREKGQVAITVVDDGIGDAPVDRPRIFERFARGTDRVTREKAGSGLGLYLSRGLAEQMCGSLTLQASQPGKGSTFVFPLPLAASYAIPSTRGRQLQLTS